MGLFSSKEKIDVGTAVARMVEDVDVPNSAQRGAVKAIMRGGNISEYLIEELIGSVGFKAERMHEWAGEDYVWGLPRGGFSTWEDGAETVQQVLREHVHPTATVEFARVGPPNSLFIGWKRLTEQYGYNPTDNTLTVNGATVYLKDMVVVIPAGQREAFQPGTLEQWGPPPNTGWIPSLIWEQGYARPFNLHTPVRESSEASAEHVLVIYTWQEQHYDPENHVMVTELKEASFTLAGTGYDNGLDYFHVRYNVAEQDYYWLYQMGAGTYEALDTLFDVPFETRGTFFPWLYFRFNKTNELDQASEAELASARKLSRYLGMDYDLVANAIDENPDVDDVEQAMMIMAVPAVSDVPIECRYLFEFFNAIYYSQDTVYPTPEHAAIAAVLQGSQYLTRNSFGIQDKRFKMGVVNMGIFKTTRIGQVARRGEHTSEQQMRDTTVTLQLADIDGNPYTQEVTVPVSYHFYRHQISDSVYEELTVVQLEVKYFIWERFASTANDDDPILLIPLDRTFTDEYTIQERELLYTRSLHYVFNSRIITQVKWYEQGWFRGLVAVIMIVIAIVTYQPYLATLVTMVEIGFFTVYAALMMVLTSVLEYVAMMMAVKLFVQEVGAEVALVVAVIAVAIGMANDLGVSGLKDLPWADQMISVGNSLISAVSDAMEEALLGLREEAEAFGLWAEEQMNLLEDAQDLLRTQNILHPFVLIGENPEDYYKRTVHNPNPGPLIFSSVSNYVDRAITLPKISDTLGGFEHGNVS